MINPIPYCWDWSRRMNFDGLRRPRLQHSYRGLHHIELRGCCFYLDVPHWYLENYIILGEIRDRERCLAEFRFIVLY
jgi:hypothetical protein